MDFIAKPVQKLSWLSGDVPWLQTPELSAWFWEAACEAERVGGGKAEKGKPAESKWRGCGWVPEGEETLNWLQGKFVNYEQG